MGIWKAIAECVSIFSNSGFKRRYNEYLQSRDWELIVDNIKRIKGNYCAKCHSYTGLNVHHKWYKTGYWQNWGNEDNGQLIILCTVCHEEIHNIIDPCTFKQLENEVQLYCKICDEPVFNFKEDESYLRALEINRPIYCDYHTEQISKND